MQSSFNFCVMEDTYINFLCWTSFPPNFLNLATLVYPERQTLVQMVPPGHLPGTSKEATAPADDFHYNDVQKQGYWLSRRHLCFHMQSCENHRYRIQGFFCQTRDFRYTIEREQAQSMIRRADRGRAPAAVMARNCATSFSVVFNSTPLNFDVRCVVFQRAINMIISEH